MPDKNPVFMPFRFKDLIHLCARGVIVEARYEDDPELLDLNDTDVVQKIIDLYVVGIDLTLDESGEVPIIITTLSSGIEIIQMPYIPRPDDN